MRRAGSPSSGRRSRRRVSETSLSLRTCCSLGESIWRSLWGPKRDALVFTAVGSPEPLNHGTLYKSFKQARSAAGREDLRLHDLRHTGAVMAAQAGATTRELMDRLGHTTSEMAMRYQHVADGRHAEIARRLSEMAEGQGP